MSRWPKYRDMTEAERQEWGALERQLRIDDLADRGPAGLLKAQENAKARRRAIDCGDADASRMVGEAGRAQRRAAAGGVEPARRESKRYAEAMMANHLATLVAIEQEHGLYGYPPEVVSVGLAAFDRGEDVGRAVDRYLGADEEGEF